jgi:hypothetical protein
MRRRPNREDLIPKPCSDWEHAGALGVASSSYCLSPPGRYLCPNIFYPPIRSFTCFKPSIPLLPQTFKTLFLKSCSLAERKTSVLQLGYPRPKSHFNQSSPATYSNQRAKSNMTVGHYDSSGDSQAYMMSPDMTPGLYDGTSSESSASSPMNCNVSLPPG